MQESNSMNIDFDVIGLSAKAASGEAPLFTGDGRLEKLLGITLSIATELAVTRERLDTVERLLDRSGVLDRESIEQFQPDDGAVAERNTLHEDYLARVFRVLR
ncbi:MAG: hypothetical protein OEU86_06520 [Gammaproteobacteria bacterium]|nr:hypothetical protein [Gammaproteobacteria bacterium]